jgi:hypothetical protein
MNLDDATAIGQGVAYAAVAAASAYGAWKARKAEKAAGSSKEAAQKAAKLSEPTGNGFAKKVTESLERIEKKGDRTEQLLIEHIASHADADVHNRRRRILRDVNEL